MIDKYALKPDKKLIERHGRDKARLVSLKEVVLYKKGWGSLRPLKNKHLELKQVFIKVSSFYERIPLENNRYSNPMWGE